MRKFLTPDVDRVKKGDLVGFSDGPGQSPENNVWEVVDYYENRWGKNLIVQNSDGDKKQVHSFSSVGIGAFHLGTPINAHRVAIAEINREEDERAYGVYFNGEAIGGIYRNERKGVWALVGYQSDRVKESDSLNQVIDYAQKEAWCKELEVEAVAV